MGYKQDGVMTQNIVGTMLDHVRGKTVCNVLAHMCAIDVYCFVNTGVCEVALPKTMREIRDSAFQDCEALTSVKFSENTRIERLGNHAFYRCKRLKAIALPEGMETIMQFCFYSSGLAEIKIPESVRSIEKYAFSNC